MFYDYEDYLIEPTEVNRVMDEIKDRLHDLVKDEVKDIMEEYREAKEKVSSLNIDIMRKKNKLIDLDREIEELEAKYEHIDKYKMPRKYIDSFAREYTGNFAPGDKVFIIDRNYKRTTCNKCKGEKKVKAIIDGEEFKINCMKCKGDGVILETVKLVKETTIDRVDFKLCFNSDRVSIWSSDAVRIVGNEYTVNPKNIFKTYEDAEKAIGLID